MEEKKEKAAWKFRGQAAIVKLLQEQVQSSQSIKSCGGLPGDEFSFTVGANLDNSQITAHSGGVCLGSVKSKMRSPIHGGRSSKNHPEWPVIRNFQISDI
jgi:hypothetical protein